MASVSWDLIQINSKSCDLATALEYLVILTSAKHKMQEHTGWQGALEEQLEQALTAAAAEHGRAIGELKVRFRVILLGGMFIGRRQVWSPFVYTYEDVQGLRQCMEPVRALSKIATGNFFKRISLSEFQDYWETVPKSSGWHVSTGRTRHKAAPTEDSHLVRCAPTCTSQVLAAVGETFHAQRGQDQAYAPSYQILVGKVPQVAKSFHIPEDSACEMAKLPPKGGPRL